MKITCKTIGLGAAALLIAAGAQAQSKGSWLVKAGINNINPQVKSGTLSGPSLPGVKVDVEDSTAPVFTAAYMFTDNLSAEFYMGLRYKHNIVGAGTIKGVGKIGSAKQVSPTLFGQYRFFAADARWRPYLGLGLTYAYFFGEEGSRRLTAMTNPGGEETRLSVDAAWGLTPQAGLTVRFDQRWFADLMVAKTYLETTTKLSTGQRIKTDLDPISVNLSLGYRF